MFPKGFGRLNQFRDRFPSQSARRFQRRFEVGNPDLAMMAAFLGAHRKRRIAAHALPDVSSSKEKQGEPRFSVR
jgi:hypothetical protein